MNEQAIIRLVKSIVPVCVRMLVHNTPGGGKCTACSSRYHIISEHHITAVPTHTEEVAVYSKGTAISALRGFCAYASITNGKATYSALV